MNLVTDIGIGGEELGGGGKIIPYVDQFQTKISATRNSTLKATEAPLRQAQCLSQSGA